MIQRQTIAYRRRKKIHSGLLLALQAASARYAKSKKGSVLSRGSKYLAEGLGCYPQAIYNWTYVPRNRVMMVHKLTGVPLEKLAPDLFGGYKRRYDPVRKKNRP